MSGYTEYELVESYGERFMQRFPIDQVPEVGVQFRVLEEEWVDSGEIPLRTVKRVELISASPD